MATEITNQAMLEYQSNNTTLSTSSNTASITKRGPMEVTKYSLENDYQIGKEITYNLFITNDSLTNLTNLSIVDDLGTYPLSDTKNITPLTYTTPAKVFIDEIYSATIDGTIAVDGSSVSFQIATLEPGKKMLLQYKCMVNQFAPAELGSSKIVNNVSVTTAEITTAITATNELPLGSYAKLMIEKTMSPNPVTAGSTVTYQFLIHNYGTIAADNVVLSDLFNPAPAIKLIKVDEAPTTDYTYTDTTGLFRYPKSNTTTPYSVDAATFEQSSISGVVFVNPATSIVTVQGDI